jgi:hypothetical protein
VVAYVISGKDYIVLFVILNLNDRIMNWIQGLLGQYFLRSIPDVMWLDVSKPEKDLKNYFNSKSKTNI